MLECIKESCLGIFAATADQRFLLGEDVFLRTHFPIAMRRFRAGEHTSTWTEEDLLRELTSAPESTPGNRTFVLYGAAGSGKSEIIRWLDCKLSGSGRREYAIRISRTELDPVKILQKILSHFRGISLEDSIYHNWEDLRKKPVTLANHLVWSALGNLLPSDKEIIPISYRLRPIIEKNLKLNFSGIDSPSELEGRTPELIALEDLEELARECSLPHKIDCGQLRFLMARELESAVLGGYNFVETLKLISHELMASRGVRPLLLIDDLVQSMNIYSTDLLDFFITMEEGNWDIIMGLTPSSFETSKRGREILNRIAALDTFDDRLIKLWLTDEQGNDSYFLSEKNCHLYAEKYLSECKSQAGYSCGSGCARVEGCVALQMGMSKRPTLSPLNQALLARIYRDLPRGKGKARYLTMAIGEILKGMLRKDFTGALGGFLKREISVNHLDPAIRLVAEAYAPRDVRQSGSVKLNGSALEIILGTSASGYSDIVAEVTDLSASKPATAKSDLDQGMAAEIDITKAAIRDWLEGAQVNKELLKGLRLGISYLCREVAGPCSISPPNTARTSSFIRWDETVEGSKVPISLEGVDSFAGIEVFREIGHAAYQLNSIHLKRGSAREAALEGALHTEEIYHLLHSAKTFREMLWARLEEEIGLPAEDFAYLLFVILMECGQGGSEVPGPIQDVYATKDISYPQDLAGELITFPPRLAQGIRSLFKDWFQIRENIYDAVKIIRMQKKYKGADPLLIIANIGTGKVSPQFTAGEMELKKSIAESQQIINQLAGAARGDGAQRVRRRLEHILDLLQELRHPGAHAEIQSLIGVIAPSLGLAQPVFPEWQSCQKLRSSIKRGLRQYIGKRGRVAADGPLAAHRLLVAVGGMEKDPEYQAMRELCDFIELAIYHIENFGGLLQEEAGKSGVLGHISSPRGWDVGIDHSSTNDRWGVEILAHLARCASEAKAKRSYIRILESASPYIDHQLAGEARATAAGMEKIAAIDFPPVILKKINQTLSCCCEYNLAFDKILNWEMCGELTEEDVTQLRSAHQAIYGGRLNALLLDIYKAWQAHLKNLHQLINCLGIEEGEKWAQISICLYDEDSGNIDNNIIIKTLYEAGGLIRDMPLLKLNREGQQAKFGWVIDLLLAPHPPEIAIDSAGLDELKSFILTYPPFARSIKFKIYLAQN